jgi:hypothetical protein
MHTRPLSTVVLALLVVPASIGLASAGQAAQPVAAPSTTGIIYTGDAYGTHASVGHTVVAGKSSLVALCTMNAGIGEGSGVASVNVPNIISSGTVSTTVGSDLTGMTATSTSTARVQHANVLSGLISARVVKAASATSHDASGFQVSATGSTFAGLVVDGNAISGVPMPNTTIRLPGVGRVVLNEQATDIGRNNASFTVNMIHVFVTHAIAGVAKGTQIVVSHATSGLAINKVGTLDGNAYGTAAVAAHTVVSGETARVLMGCGGTGGDLNTNSVTSVKVPKVLSTGTVTDTAQGSISGTKATSETTSTVQGVKALGGLVTADVIKADAHATKASGTRAFGDAGSVFTNLVVNGKQISGHVAANTKIVIGNITVWLHRVLHGPTNIEVRMVEIVASGPNPFGLHRGTHVRVAVAEASAH